jgi:2-oxoglutarate ferredoxin oxidoreductase subunit alpha
MLELIDGATAIARAALDAGCTFFAGYPISPATPLLLHMIRELPAAGGIAIQAEDEIAAISMCIGAAMTGSRALTATSGPGMSLFSESIGLAIMGEAPLVIVDAQRMGPATGGATTPAQGDVQFARRGASGGYPIIALAPHSVADCYNLTLRAFDLAERFRCPVFVLTDKEMFQSLSTVSLEDYAPFPVRVRMRVEPLPAGTGGLRPEESFLPWRFEPIDQPPAFSPYGGPHILRFTGSSHDEHGFLTKDPQKVGLLNEHLWRKIEDHADEIALALPDAQDDSRTLCISYGITARAMVQAVADWRSAGGRVSALTVQSLWPVPERLILDLIASATPAFERIVVAELNLGDYRIEIERHVYRWAAQNRLPPPEIIGLNRVDGELITPAQFAKLIL